MKVEIAGTTVDILRGSLVIEDSIEERSIASFSVVDLDNSCAFRQGQLVSVYDGQNLLFAGVVDKATKKKVSPDNAMVHHVSCIDWHYLADKRIIARAYHRQAVEDIVTDIWQNYLGSEGVELANVQAGPVIEEAVFNYVSVTDALKSLAEKAGYWWRIDQYKMLHFVKRSTNIASIEMTNKDIVAGSIQIDSGNVQYRNRQYVKGGRDVTDPQTQTFKGDGKNQTFTVGYPIAKTPTIKVNEVQQTVGIRGIDKDMQWYWSKNDNVITQDSDATPLSESDTLSITYQGFFDIVVLTYDPEAIEEQVALSGGTGWVEDVHDDVNISSREAAFELANSKLKKYAVLGRRIRFKTWLPGLQPGQLLHITLSEYGVNDELLIERVEITREEDDVYYTVTAIEGPTQGSWARLFHNLATRGQPFVIRENIREDQTLITLSQFSKTWQISDVPNIFLEVYPSNNLFPGPDTYPMFDFEDRVKYMVLLDNEGNEMLRKIITKQTGANTNEILSTVHIAPFEGNGQITSIAWFGGDTASLAPNSGVLVDQQPFARIKTQFEALQIDKRDIRGW